MAKKLQILRGTTAQNDAYTGSIGELTMDTEKVEVRIHDGTTQGGKTIGVTIEQLNNKADTTYVNEQLATKANIDLSNLTSVGKNKLGPAFFRVTGRLLNSIDDTVEGHGIAEIYLYKNGVAIINYSILCTTSGSSTSKFQWGLNRDLISGLNADIPTITPKGGTMTYYETNGTVSSSSSGRNGYAGALTPYTQFWQPSRVYNLDGQVGGWPAGNFVANQRIVGTAWGTYEI